MLIAALWPNSTFDSVISEAAQKLTKDVASIAEEMGLLHDFQYINYADPSQDPIAGYGPENVKRLKEASKKYDPKQVWQKKVPGGFKLY